jgi:hypothetical protein
LKKQDGFRVSKKYAKRWKDKMEKKFRKKGNPKDFKKNKESESYKEKIEGRPDKEVDQRRKATECLRCAWQSDRKGVHKTILYYRPIKIDEGTADFPKAKAYQKMKIGAVETESGEKDLYNVESESEELRVTPSETELSEE